MARRRSLASGLAGIALHIAGADHHRDDGPELKYPFGEVDGGAGMERTAYIQSDFDTAREWTIHILNNSESRRRWGTYNQESELCSPVDNISYIRDACRDFVAPNLTKKDFKVKDGSLPDSSWEAETNCLGGPETKATCCHACMACETLQCLESLSGCTGFFNEIYYLCDMEEPASPSDNPGYVMLGLVGGVAANIIAMVCYKWSSRFSVANRLEVMANQRKDFVADRGSLPDILSLSGSWTFDKGGDVESQQDYTLELSDPGIFNGSVLNTEWNIKGKVNVTAGKIGWVESSSGVFKEVDGILKKSGKSFTIEAVFLTSKGKSGRMNLSGTGLTSPMALPTDAIMVSEDVPPIPPGAAFHQNPPIGNPIVVQGLGVKKGGEREVFLR